MALLDKMDPQRAKSAPGAIELNRHFGAETDLLNLQCTFQLYRSSAVSLFVFSGCLPIGLLHFKAGSVLMHDVLNNLSPRNALPPVISTLNIPG